MSDSIHLMQQKNQGNQPKYLGVLSIYIIKKLTNFFWIIIDTMSYRSKKIALLYNKSISKEYLSEYSSLGIKKENKILHIGCGPYPLTEISLAQQFGAQIVGIDKNQRIIKMAKKIIKEHSLENLITIEHGNGIDYPMDNYDMIIISSCAFPKKKILENIIHTAKKNCIITIRELDIAVQSVKSLLNKHKNLTVIKKTHHNPVPRILKIPWTSISIRIN
jgi:2-polyprenyl-3-methyl-5-hydroxy-6-metoxy-1,4-benzoquinol methylase